MTNTKLNVYEIVSHEVCEKFSVAEEYIKKRIEELRCNLLVQEQPQVSLKSYKHHFECGFISLIFFALCISLLFFALCLLQTQNLEVNDAILTTKKTKSEIKKELEDSIANGKKNKNTDIEEMVNNCGESEEVQQKLFTNLKKLLGTKKVTQNGQLTIKVKYFRSLDLKNDLLMIWLQNLK